MILAFPQLLGLSVQRTLRPTARFLVREAGLPLDRLGRAIVGRPQAGPSDPTRFRSESSDPNHPFIDPSHHRPEPSPIRTVQAIVHSLGSRPVRALGSLGSRPVERRNRLYPPLHLLCAVNFSRHRPDAGITRGDARRGGHRPDAGILRLTRGV